MKAVHEGRMSLKDALNSSALGKINSLLTQWRASMQIHRTPKLWIQYQRMVQILWLFIWSVRIGNWSLYLQSLSDTLPYLAAAGHNNYTKSLALFIPKMMDLEQTHPDVHKALTKGLFPVRRTDGAWTDMFTDLFIEVNSQSRLQREHPSTFSSFKAVMC
jgi:hypothetical protein